MDLSSLSLQDISDALVRRDLTSLELTRQAIGQKESNPYSNPYKCWDPEKGIAAAARADRKYDSGKDSAPLQGIPISVKDIYGHPDFPIFAGSHRELPRKWRDAGPIVKSLQAQLSVFLGKTHTVEFAYGGLGVNNHWGTPKNPWCTECHRVPGGSSSGAGISICQRSAFVALGTDTAGSVRIPASYAGVVGLKTSCGLWPTKGITPLSPILDTVGILTKTAKDAAYAFHALNHPRGTNTEHRKRLHGSSSIQTEPIRIGLAESGIMWDCDEDISKLCMYAIRSVESGAFRLVPIDFPNAEMAIDMRNRGGTASVELIEFISRELPEWLDNLDPIISERVKIGGDISAIEYLSRVRQIKEDRIKVRDRFDVCDVIAAPTVPISPPMLHDVMMADDYMAPNLMALRNTCVANYLDLCAISIPVGLDGHGMPVGIQFMAPAGQEPLLLAIGQKFETVIPAPDFPI